MADKLIFSKGLEKDLPKSNIVTGGLYYCTDTGNTYIGTSSTTMKLYSTGALAGTKPGLVKSGGNATINNGIINVKGITATALDMSGGKTIGNLQTQLKNWLANNTNTPGACCTFVGTLSDVMAKWSDTSNTFTGGATNTVHSETLYGHNDYALLRFTCYANKEVYYAAISNGTWGSMYKAAFNDEIITKVIAGNGLTGGGSANSSTGVTLNVGQGSGITVTADTVSHADTSSVSNLTANGRKYVTGLTFDTYGHVTGYTTDTETVVDTDTKNTAGATNIDSKLFLIGATSQNTNPQTYSHDTVYIGTDGHLYSNNSKVFSTSYAPEAYLSWGGRSISGGVTPIGAALSSEHSANRLSFLNPAALSMEYSNDGGTTWTASSWSNTDKINHVTTASLISVGSASTVTTNHRTRVTLTAQNGTNGYVYTRPKKLLINVSSAGHGLNVKIEYKNGKSDGTWNTLGTYSLSGWSGWNDIDVSAITSLGGGTNQTSNYWYWRFTYGITSVNISYATTKATVLGIRLFGDTCWTRTSNMGETGHLYSYDTEQNATFPAQVAATQFNGNATSATKLTSSDGSATQPVYFSDGKPIAIKQALGSAAYTESTAYATTAQGTKADNAMPKAGGTFTGGVSIGTYSGTNGGLDTFQVRNIAIASSTNVTGAKVGDIIFIAN